MSELQDIIKDNTPQYAGLPLTVMDAALFQKLYDEAMKVADKYDGCEIEDGSYVEMDALYSILGELHDLCGGE